MSRQKLKEAFQQKLNEDKIEDQNQTTIKRKRKMPIDTSENSISNGNITGRHATRSKGSSNNICQNATNSKGQLSQPSIARSKMSSAAISTILIEKSELIVMTPRDNHTKQLIAQFSSLDRVLYQKKKIVDWETLREAVVRTCGFEILLTDLDAILEVYPTAYSLYWQIDKLDQRLFQLSIRLPKESVGKTETRLNTFRENLEEWCLLHPNDQKIIAKLTSIPPKPQNQMDNLRNTCAVSKIALLAEEERHSLEDSQKTNSLSTGMASLNESKLLAEKRYCNKDLLAMQLLNQQNMVTLKNRIVSLPSLCDALRSKCVSTNRTCMKTSDLMHIMTAELFLTKKELMNRLCLLTGIIPEFITILPGDDIVAVSVIRLNLQANYSLIRKKIITYVNSTNSHVY